MLLFCVFDRNAYDNNRYHQRMSEIRALLGNRCAEPECGKSSSEVQLQIDHKTWLDKSFTISKLWTMPWEKLLVEVNKCVLRCHPCHVIKSQREGDSFPATSHGKRRMYMRGCRCRSCTSAQTDYMREYKKRKRNGDTEDRRKTSLKNYRELHNKC